MILEILASATAAAAPQGGPTAPTPVSPVTVEAQRPGKPPPVDATVNVAQGDDATGGIWASVWPADAYEERIPGHVVLRCNVDRYGLAEACQVVYEKPPGKGFGAAALQLRPTLKVKPATGPDGPIDAVMNIGIDFDPPDPQYNFASSAAMPGQSEDANPGLDMMGNPAQRRAISMLNNPVWARTVSYDDVTRAYPAKAGGVEGYAVAHCEVDSRGRLSGCQVIREDPEKRGFGQAALALASRFLVAPEWAVAPRHAALWVDIPFRFPPPGAAQARTVASPYWLTGFDPDAALKLYPPEAAAQGVTTGRGVARCTVTQDGRLTDCTPAPAEPEGLGFSEAAVKLASTMRMNPWSRDGAPVDGATILVAVTLNLSAK
jgi:TonB family protein